MVDLDEPIGDGNGGTLDPMKQTQRDLLVVLHYKVDRLIKAYDEHEDRIRDLEGEAAVAVFSRASRQRAWTVTEKLAVLFIGIVAALGPWVALLWKGTYR